ncbi:MAG: O-antigen ligase family protein, partial [Pseudobdellovibrionaceae bacterium]
LEPRAKLWDLKRWELFFPKLLVGKFFWLWWVIVAIGLFLNDSQNAPILKVLIGFKWILIWYVLVFVLVRIKISSQVFFWSTLVVLSTTLYSLILFFMKYDPGENIWYDSINSMRSGGFFYNPMTYAHSFAMIFFVMLTALLGASFHRQKSWNSESSDSKGPSLKVFFQSFLQSDDKKWRSYLNLIAFFLLFLSVFLSMTRGVWMGMFVGLLIMAFMIRPLIGFVTLALGSLTVATLFLSWKTFAERVMHVFQYENNYDIQRVTIWKANWNIFLDHPWFGMGYTENARRLAEYYIRMGIPEDQFFISHAHNQYLHMLAGTGVFGLTIFLLILGYFLVVNWTAWKLEKDVFTKYILLGCLCAQISFHIGALTEANFEHSKVRFVLMIIWAFAMARYINKSESRDRASSL